MGLGFLKLATPPPTPPVLCPGDPTAFTCLPPDMALSPDGKWVLISPFRVKSLGNVLNPGLGDSPVFSVELVPGVNGGTFELIFGGYTTTPIGAGSDYLTIQNALEALPSIGVGNVRVIQLGPNSAYSYGWNVEFLNALEHTTTLLLGNFSGLTAYSWAQPNIVVWPVALYAYDAITHRVTHLVSYQTLPVYTDVVGFAWHPTGSWLALTTGNSDGTYSCNVYPIDSAGNFGVPILAPGNFNAGDSFTPCWSPSGNSLMTSQVLNATLNPDAVTYTWTLTLTGAPFNQVTQTFGTSFTGVTFPSGTSFTNATNFAPVVMSNLVISPDTHLLGGGDPDSPYYIVNLSDASGQYCVLGRYSDVTGPGAQFNGGIGLYLQASGDQHIWGANNFVFSPDGKYIYCNGDSGTIYHFLPSEGGIGSSSLVTNAPNSVVWSADGDWIAFAYAYNDTPSIYAWTAVSGLGTQALAPHSNGYSIYLAGFMPSPANDVVCIGGQAFPDETPGFSLLYNYYATGVKQHTTDALIVQLTNVVHTTDALLRTIPIGGHPDHFTDALLYNLVSLTHTTDALLIVPPGQRRHSTDALIARLVTRHHTTDALLKQVNLPTTFTTNALLRALRTRSFSTDTLLKRVGRPKTHKTDALLAVIPHVLPHSSSLCMPESDDVDGRQGIGVIQPPGYAIDYPLVDPSTDIQYLLADAQLTFEDPADYDSELSAYTFPFRVVWLYGLGCIPNTRPSWAPQPTHPVDLVIQDANDRTVFDSTAATYYQAKAWGPRLELYEWRTATDCMRLVVHTKWSPDGTPSFQNYTINITPGGGGVLDSRAWYRIPKRVKSLIVSGSTFASLPELDLINGYNTTLHWSTPTAKPGRKQYQQIEVGAAPGSGIGTYPGCSQVEVVLRAVNGIPGDQYGNFMLAATDCYWVRPVSNLNNAVPAEAVVIPSMLQIGDDCIACCQCSDYEKVYQYLAQIAGQYQAIGDQAQTVRNDLKDMIYRFKQQKVCYEASPLQLVVTATACPMVQIIAQYSNVTSNCIGPLTMHLEFSAGGTSSSSAAVSDLPDLTEGFESRPRVVPGSVFAKTSVPASFKKGVLSGGWPHYTISWDKINPRDNVVVQFSLQFHQGHPLLVQGQLTAVLAGVDLGQVAEDQDTTQCPAPS